jgi:uncharacterized protein
MFPQICQLIPSEICLQCPVCCRFPDKQAGLSPFFFEEERTRAEDLCGSKIRNAFRQEGPSKAELVPYRDAYACPFYHASDSTCGIYGSRPLDCAIYPVVVTRNQDGQGVFVGVDHKCPALERPEIAARIEDHLESVRGFLETPDIARLLRSHPEFIGECQEEASHMRELSLERV